MVLISDLDEIEALTKYLNESKLAMLTFKRNELSIELVIQLSVHLIMVCLSQTDYPLESGLQGIFQVRLCNRSLIGKILEDPNPDPGIKSVDFE